ncbi:MAG: GumC family protein [Bryobacteraceae bacterium]
MADPSRLLPPAGGPLAAPGSGPGPYPPGGWYGPEYEFEQPGTPLSHYVWILKRHRWKILSFVATCVIATLVVSQRLTPIYESTATIDIDRRMPTGILGPESAQSAINDADQFLATQVKLIQSDSVLRPVVARYKLEVEDTESVRSAQMEDAPVKLPHLKVTRPPNTYLLLVSYRSTDPRLAANVANAISNSYIEHTYNIRYRSSVGLSAFMEKQLEELKAKMERSSAALAQFERELNVINPEEKTSILSARLLQLNTEYTNAQGERVRKEAAYQSVRSGSVEAALASSQGEALKKLAERFSEAQEKFAQVKVHYGANHPEHRKAAAQVAQLQQQLDDLLRSIMRRVEIEYREALNREAMLKQAVDQTKAEFDRLNARSFEYQALKREAEADKKLYEELVRKIKEAGINAGFQNSSIRLADPARPALKPVFPNLKLNLVLAFLFSSLLAVGAAVLSDAMDKTIRDPEQVARTMNTQVVGSLPMVKSWRRQLPAVTAESDSKALVPAGRADRTVTSFEEAVQTLRNSILLADFDRGLRSLMVTSACPAEGKTTTAAHLALTHAAQGHKTLLVDGDLRRPGIHRMFGLNGTGGLSQVVLKGERWQEALVKLEQAPNLDILPAGTGARRAAHQVGKTLREILKEAEPAYDLMVVDTPPVLGFPESFEMATLVDGVLVVALAGQTERKAVSSVLQTLGRLRVNVVGLVLNEVTSATSDGYYYYVYYGKYYKSYYHRDGEQG